MNKELIDFVKKLSDQQCIKIIDFAKTIALEHIQPLSESEPISWENISSLCSMLHCQPGDIMEYVEDEPP